MNVHGFNPSILLQKHTESRAVLVQVSRSYVYFIIVHGDSERGCVAKGASFCETEIICQRVIFYSPSFVDRCASKDGGIAILASNYYDFY